MYVGGLVVVTMAGAAAVVLWVGTVDAVVAGTSLLCAGREDGRDAGDREYGSK